MCAAAYFSGDHELSKLTLFMFALVLFSINKCTNTLQPNTKADKEGTAGTSIPASCLDTFHELNWTRTVIKTRGKTSNSFSSISREVFLNLETFPNRNCLELRLYATRQTSFPEKKRALGSSIFQHYFKLCASNICSTLGGNERKCSAARIVFNLMLVIGREMGNVRERKSCNEDEGEF